MTTNDDLDTFFKKKDRGHHKNKKQTGLLTNNEELLKQLKNVTSAQRDYVEFEDEIDEFSSNMNNYPIVINHSNEFVEHSDVKHSSVKIVSNTNKNKAINKSSMNENEDMKKIDQQQDEWEDYEQSIDKFEELRLKLTGNHGDRLNDEDDEDLFDDQDETTRENRFDEEQNDKIDRSKGKIPWKVERITKSENELSDPTKTNQENVRTSDSKVEEQKTNGSGVYLPPHARNNASITIVSGSKERKTKKDKPNIASTEEFPTLAAIRAKKS